MHERVNAEDWDCSSKAPPIDGINRLMHSILVHVGAFFSINAEKSVGNLNHN